MPSQQFSLQSLLLIIAVFCAVLALVVSSNHFIQLVSWSVIAANIVGSIVALFVTHVLEVPRDGGYRYDNLNQKDKKF